MMPEGREEGRKEGRKEGRIGLAFTCSDDRGLFLDCCDTMNY